MPLILVIVADPHEAAQLATLIQGRLPVDLVQAAEVGEGLLSLEDRIPDLILTSPLMSPFDDGVLDEYLRDLGPAGAHVQTLRIPVLSQAPKKAKRLGFSLRRRSKPEAPTLDGCEPKVFVDEIEQYLARAAEEKRHAASSDQAAGVVEQGEVAEPVIAEEHWTAAYSEDEPVASTSWSTPAPEPELEPEPEPAAWRADLLDRPLDEETPLYQPSPAAYEEPTVAYESPIEVAAPVEEPAAVERVMPDTVVEAIAEPAIEDVVEPAPIETYRAVPVIEEVVEPGPIDETFEVAETIDAAPSIEAAPSIDETPVIDETPAIDETPVIEEPAIEEAQITAVAVEAVPVVVAARRPSATDVDENKATPSFKAALAAIRAAWGKPPRTGDSPAGVPESSAPTRVEQEPVAAAHDVPESFEVDLTDVVEVLDEDPMDVDLGSAATMPQAPVDPVAETVEVYELSVEPDLSEFETQLITPVAPQRERPAPKTVPPAPVVEEHKAVESAPASAADANGDRRKKGKRATKGAKTPAPRQGKAQPPAAQNEWGIFDPNQCGFAALVDKLDEVADKKAKQQPNGAKARVISLS